MGFLGRSRKPGKTLTKLAVASLVKLSLNDPSEIVDALEEYPAEYVSQELVHRVQTKTAGISNLLLATYVEGLRETGYVLPPKTLEIVEAIQKQDLYSLQALLPDAKSLQMSLLQILKAFDKIS